MGAGPGGAGGHDCDCNRNKSSTIGFGRNPKPISLGQIAWIIGLIVGVCIIVIII